MTARPPADWYPDPGDDRFLRWWNGSAWTEHTWARPNQAYNPYGVGQVRLSASSLYAREKRMLLPVRGAVVAFPILEIASGLLLLATASGWARYFHSLRVELQQAQAGAQPQTLPSGEPHWTFVLLPFSLGAEVLFAVWQYRAAQTARSLGYPAKLSPALGAWSYIIPIVQLWFPYWALRDCLPPEHPSRPLVLRIWLLIMATAVLNSGLLITLAEARAVGIALLAVDIVLLVTAIVWGWRMVDAISADHREAVGVPVR